MIDEDLMDFVRVLVWFLFWPIILPLIAVKVIWRIVRDA